MNNTGTTDILNAEQAETLAKEVISTLGEDKYTYAISANNSEDTSYGYHFGVWTKREQPFYGHWQKDLVFTISNTRRWEDIKQMALCLARSLEIAEQDAWNNTHPVLPEVSDLDLVAENGPVLFEADFIV